MNTSRTVASSCLYLLILGSAHAQSPPITDDDWEGLSGLTSRNATALPVLNNTIYAVGDGLQGGGINNDLLKWDGKNWTLPGGSPVSPIAIHGYYFGSDDTAIYFGALSVTVGLFGPRYFSYIYGWYGNSWYDTGLGESSGGAFHPPYLSAMQTYAGRYVLAGSFTTPIPYLLATSNQSYYPLGSGPDGPVNLVKAAGTNLYIAGQFMNAGGHPAKNVAVWNGSEWKSLGAGFAEVPYSMAVSGSNLYLASVDTVSKWDGRSWTKLGSGFNSNKAPGEVVEGIFAMAATEKELFVGGWFTMAGNTPATNIARWDGTTWSALGSGVQVTNRAGLDFNHPIDAISVLGDYLYVAGDLNLAGDKASVGFARVNIAGPKKLLNHPMLNLPRSVAFTFDNGVVGRPYRIQTANSLHSGTWSDYTNFIFTQPVNLTVPISTNNGAKFIRSVSP